MPVQDSALNRTWSNPHCPPARMSLYKRSVILPPSSLYPLHITANCYTPQITVDESVDAVTLILLHSAAFHKEMFEPTISALFNSLQARGGDGDARQGSTTKIHEVWSIECPNHGQSAVLNEGELRKPEYDEKCQYYSHSLNNYCILTLNCIFPPLVCVEEYAKAAYVFLTSGTNIDFKTRKVIGIGHSVGGVGL